MASIGGFCVGSHFIVEHQRLSGLGYCFSASLPPLLAQAAITALDCYEEQPQIFEELQKMSVALHKKFLSLTHLMLGGDALSPVKHLYLRQALNDPNEEQKVLTQISNKVIS